MGASPAAPPSIQPVKPVPPPAQVSASLAAVRGGKQDAAAIGDLGGTILGGAIGDAPLRSPGDVMYGKKLTGA